MAFQPSRHLAVQMRSRPLLVQNPPVFSLPPGRVQCPQTRMDPPLGAAVTTRTPPSVPRAPLAATDPVCTSSGNRAAHTHRPPCPALLSRGSRAASLAALSVPSCGLKCVPAQWKGTCKRLGLYCHNVCASSQSHIQDLEHSTMATLPT